jgi:hypothetical protein
VRCSCGGRPLLAGCLLLRVVRGWFVLRSSDPFEQKGRGFVGGILIYKFSGESFFQDRLTQSFRLFELLN